MLCYAIAGSRLAFPLLIMSTLCLATANQLCAFHSFSLALHRLTLPSHVAGVHFLCSATTRLAAATHGFAARFVTSLALGCAFRCHRIPRHASPLPRTAEQCRFDTSPCKAPAVRYHSDQCDSFAVPCRAVPWHCLSFDALPQQIISQPRDAIALQFRGDSWQVSALPLHHSAPLALPLLAGAIWYQILTRTNQ